MHVSGSTHRTVFIHLNEPVDMVPFAEESTEEKLNELD